MPDPVFREELEVVTAMLQFTLVFGQQKVVDAIPRKRTRIPKLKHYEVRCWQGWGCMVWPGLACRPPIGRQDLSCGGRPAESPVLRTHLLRMPTAKR